MINTRGGLLVVGLDDEKNTKGDSRLLGISEGLDNISEFKKLLKSEFEPPLHQLVSVQEIEITNNKKLKDKLFLVWIEKSQDVHSLKNGDTFIRTGSHNTKIGSQEITRLKYEKGSIKSETEVTIIDSLDQLDIDLINKYKKDNKSSNEDTWQFLKDSGLALELNNKHLLTKGGALIFAKNPSVLLSGKYGVRVSHYYGTKPNYSGEPNFVKRPFTIEGPLIIQIQKSVEYFREVVATSNPKLSGSTFKPSVIIPEQVFQEAIANAVIHRNYSVQNDIQVRFFDDRIEIESPGTYPGYITVNNIRKERFARNPLIQRTLSRFSESPNLDIGEGVDRMFATMKTHNLYEPLYFPANQFPNSVLLYLMNLNKVGYWDTVSNYIDRKSLITNQKAREVTSIQDTLEMSRLLNTWVANGLLERKGGKTKGAYYVKPGRELPDLFFKVSEK